MVIGMVEHYPAAAGSGSRVRSKKEKEKRELTRIIKIPEDKKTGNRNKNVLNIVK